jgi:large repetitive protein
VHPLFSCGTPANEPSCEASITRECPFAESACQAVPRAPAWDERDADGDGVFDLHDVCPRAADAEQLDGDGDGKGDACDACPVYDPGLIPCPIEIAQLRAPESRLTLGLAVTAKALRVTALRASGSKGFYAEDGDHAPYSGIFVYTGSKVPAVAVGDLATVQGYFGAYQGTDELLEVDVLARRAATRPYPPLDVSLSEAADGSARAAGLASLFVRIHGLEVALMNPDAPNDYDETGLVGGLRLDDLIFSELDNAFSPGTRFSYVQGINGRSFSHQKLWPTQPSDLLLP